MKQVPYRCRLGHITIIKNNITIGTIICRKCINELINNKINIANWYCLRKEDITAKRI